MIDSTEKNAENAFRKGVRLTKTHQLDDDFIHVLVNILRIDPKRRASTAAILAFRFFSRVQSQANKKGRSYVYEHPLPKYESVWPYKGSCPVIYRDYDWAVMNVNVFPVGNFDSIIVVADANKEPGKAIVTLYPHPCLAGRDCALLYRTETFPLHEHIRAKGHQALPSKAFGFYDPCWYLRTRRFVNRCFVCMNW